MKGGCFCGAVRYELIRPPKEAYYCHCRDCQYLSGSSYHVLGVVERNTLKLLSGELSEYSYVTHDGSGLKRETCKKCGSPLFVTSSSFEDIQMFTVSTLDEPESMKPSFEIWTCSKVSWANIQGEISSFTRGAFDDSSE